MGISGEHTVSYLWVSRGPLSLPSRYISKECPWGSLKGLSLGSHSISGSQKVTLLSNQCLLGDLRCLSKDWLCGWLLLWLWRWEFCASPTYWLSLSLSLSQHMGSLECLLVGLPGLQESLIMWVFPPPGPRPGFCSSLWCILLGLVG